MNLVVVESPAKSKTLKKFLGKDYQIIASYGHIRDLIPKGGAVDPDKSFAMHYRVLEDRKRQVNAIIAKFKQADRLYLATDPDREGEAISWHLCEILREKKILKEERVHRVVFFEITKGAVLEAFAHPRHISTTLIDAQQARRALDYLIGFTLSPLLCKKVGGGLSAGRVQSPALRLIVDREDEIEAFVKREYWSITAQLDKDGEKFNAYLYKKQGVKLDRFAISTEKSAHEIRAALQVAKPVQVLKVDKKERKRRPPPPFMTSTLQQEAARKLGFSAKRTMMVAQQLYEGVDLGAGQVGLITYMRTDSLVLSSLIVKEIRDYILRTYGQDNLPREIQVYKNRSKNAQEAHEAIRPTSISNVAEKIKSHLSAEQFRLYELIWKRTLACQMMYANYDTVSADIACGNDFILRASGSTLKHPGFLTVYQEGSDNDEVEAGAGDNAENKRLPELQVDELLTLDKVTAEQNFTKPPPRYTEASLIKTLEQHGIGRPSTYAAILSTIQARNYVELEKKHFKPTPTGRMVSRFLADNFTRYVDYAFTAHLEDELDEVSRGELDWRQLMEKFWQPFKSLVQEKDEAVSRSEVMTARILGTDPKSGKEVSVRFGRYGPFVQIGHRDDEEKPRFASLRAQQKIDTINLEEALQLFTLPRALGETDRGEPVQACSGRWGPYLKYGDNSVSLASDDDPYTITLERALAVIAEKKKLGAEKIIKNFEGSTVQVLKGRWGPYVSDGKKNVALRDDDPHTITLERALAVIAEKKKLDAEKIIKNFEGSTVQVLKGRWGPYVSDGKKNVKIASGQDPKLLTLEMCQNMIAKAPAKKGRRKSAKKKNA